MSVLNTVATAGSAGSPDRPLPDSPEGVRSITSLAPAFDGSPQRHVYLTAGGIRVTRTIELVPLSEVLEAPRKALDHRRGGIFTSNYEYPDRYRRFDIAFVDPCLALEGYGRRFKIRPLNNRGAILLPTLFDALRSNPHILSAEMNNHADAESVIEGEAATPEGVFPEEERSHQPSIFSVLRVFGRLFYSAEDPHLGLYGAFGYDLVFQFEPVPLRHERSGQPDLVLYLPDEIRVADRPRECSYRVRYDFEVDGQSTEGLSRTGEEIPLSTHEIEEQGDFSCDHAPGDYAGVVSKVREGCRLGDFFEVVPGQVFSAPCAAPPSWLFKRLCQRNPSPYGFFLHLGGEHLVGASPEMFVRVEGRRVETCPISGTIARGADPIADAHQIRELLNSTKDEAELTMCTDVDRNDKSRICEPGSVRVLGRRQVELYSRVIHTVDHVEGILRPGFDALDAFLSHMWAVTVTGAPKRAAMACIERMEKSPRRFYGGAVGFFTFNGNINTGITIRTIRLANGIGEVRAGATLLYDSDPYAEERETRTKASAMLDVIRQTSREYLEDRHHGAQVSAVGRRSPQGGDRDIVSPLESGEPVRILLVDHQDSFVHTLANYFRQAGADVTTLRAPIDDAMLDAVCPDLVVLSPGPGRPEDFAVPQLVRRCAERGQPTFGVCLGLQGMVEAFGGELGVLPAPMHGKPSSVTHDDHPLFKGLPRSFQAGRYHSLFARPDSFPADLECLARSEDQVIMAVCHRDLPLAAVQFHPESILSQEAGTGLRLVRNAVDFLVRGRSAAIAR